jgi:hypothetical protein
MGEVGQPWADVQTSHNAGNTAAGKVTPVSEFKDAIYPKRLPSYAVPDEMKKRKNRIRGIKIQEQMAEGGG